MTRKRRSDTSARSQSAAAAGKTQRRSLIGTVIGAVVLIAALVITNLTGIDVLGLIGANPTPTARPVTIAPPTALPTAVVTLPPAPTLGAQPPTGSITPVQLPLGVGAEKGFWEVLFTLPNGSRDRATYVGGIEDALVIAINNAQRSLDIAAFEWNLTKVNQAVIAAHQRGVQVRMVTDNEHGLEDDDSLVPQLIAAGIPVVDDNRSALMHNKFIIIDRSVVWTGSWNFTINDTYRNNNNAIALRSRRAVDLYQNEFNQMFERRIFGPRKTPSGSTPYTQDGTPIEIYFAPEDPVLPAIINTISRAQFSVRFMNFSFTDFDVAKAIIDQAAAVPGLIVQGIFETVGSETQASELRTLFCAGLNVRQDGNSFILHHKVFIVDDRTVITGSFNISTNATTANDENLIIITDPDLAAQYLAEFNRRWAQARVPGRITCS